MDDDFLKELLSDVEAMKAAKTEPSARERRLFRTAIGYGNAEPQVVSAQELKIIVLKILSRGRADGGEIAERLKDLGVRLVDEGEGPIFALLARMTDDGLIRGEFDPSLTKKYYGRTDRGSEVLNREGEDIRSRYPVLGALWAV